MQAGQGRDEIRHHADAFEAELRDQPAVSMGTTIMACTYGEGLEGGVILGADTRTSSGAYIANRASDKITQLTDKVFVCRSGSAADTQNLAAYVTYYLHQHCMDLGREADVKTAAKLTQLVAYNNKKGGSVWGIPLGGTLVQQPFSLGGSGSGYIYGFCDKNWRPGMTEEECKAFVVQSVSHAIARDGSSGGNIRTVIINKSGVKRDYLPGSQVPLHFDEYAKLYSQAALASA